MSALTGMLWRQHASRGRLLAIGVVGAVVVALGVAILVGDGSTDAALALVAEAGVGLLVPVTAVVFASSVLGDPAEDGTLGYLLTTPRPRWQLATPALTAATATVVPLAVVPLVVTLAINGADGATVGAVTIASGLAAVAYTAVFTAVGVRYRHALLGGLLYVAIWESVVARFGTGLARLSVRQYALSLVAGMRGNAPPPGGVGTGTAVVVLLAVALAGAGITTWFLRTHESRA